MSSKSSITAITGMKYNIYTWKKKYKEIEENEVRFEEFQCEDADVILVAYGTREDFRLYHGNLDRLFLRWETHLFDMYWRFLQRFAVLGGMNGWACENQKLCEHKKK